MEKKIQQLKQLIAELNLKSIQTYRKGKGRNGCNMHYVTVEKNIKKGIIDCVNIDGSTFIIDK